MSALPYIVFVGMLIPGWLFARCMGFDRYPILTAFSVGLGIAVACISLSGILRFSWTFTLAAYFSIFFVLFGCFVFKIRTGSSEILKRLTYKTNWRGSVSLLCIVSLYCLYFYLVGAYDLVPSDALRHLERTQFALRDINDGLNNWFDYRTGKNDYYMYYLFAITWKLSGQHLGDFFYHISLISNLVFLSALYLFTRAIFNHLEARAEIIAIVTCVFFVLYQGFAAFPYLRYYALSPTLWAMPVYFLFVLQVRDSFESSWSKQTSGLLFLLLATSLLVHEQEFFFMLIMAALLLIYYTLSAYAHNHAQLWSSVYQTPSHSYRKLTLCSIGFLTVSFLVVIWAYSVRHRFGFEPQKIINLSEILPFARNLYVLDPGNQFYKVIAMWGYVVYGCSLIFYRKILGNPYLVCGLLLPFFTVFNPVFVDLFLRLTDKPVLYRFTYMVPISMAGAYIVVILAEGAINKRGLGRAARFGLLVILVVSLFPVDNRYVKNHYTRVPWLGVVPLDQSLRYWSDLTDYVWKLGSNEKFHSDPVTAYMIRSTTGSDSPGYKFYPYGSQFINSEKFDADTLRPYSGDYLVINQREGGLSQPGSISSHWPEDILKLQKFYPPELLRFIDSNSTDLDLIWQRNGVRIFRIR